jgi:hypothetical protein
MDLGVKQDLLAENLILNVFIEYLAAPDKQASYSNVCDLKSTY